MQDQQQENPLDAIVNDINNTLNTPVVYVRRSQTGGQPYIDMTTQEPQLLHIVNEDYPIYVEFNHNSPVIRFGNNWVLRGYRVDYEVVRHVLQTTFPISHKAYSAMFSYGIKNNGGAQAVLVDEPHLKLYVIDNDTAIALRDQCVTCAGHQSLIYRLVIIAYRLLQLTEHLYEWISQGVIDDEIIEQWRTYIYGSIGRYVRQLLLAEAADVVYRSAIVRTNTMEALRPHHTPMPPLQLPVAQIGQLLPFDGNIGINQLNDNIQELTHSLQDIELYTRDWEQEFNRFANLDTSTEFENIAGQQHIVLNNGQEFDLVVGHGVTNIDGIEMPTHMLWSENFTDSHNRTYRLIRVPDWNHSWIIEKNTRMGFIIPLHSHGLAGSHPLVNNNNLNLLSGNNGCQTMSLNFVDIPQLNHQRVYFVNRNMAAELLTIFETNQALAQYHRFFEDLLPLTQTLCDMRRAVQNNADIDQQLIQWMNTQSQVLFGFANRLFNNYKWLVSLEQIWKYAILAPNINAPNLANREHPPHAIPTQLGVYGLGDSMHLQPKWQQEILQLPQ